MHISTMECTKGVEFMCFPVKELMATLGTLDMIKKLTVMYGWTDHKCHVCSDGVIKTKVTNSGVSGTCQQCGYSFGG